MTPQRPTAVLVLAIFHFIFGGLGLICGLCGVGMQVFKLDTLLPQPQVNDPQLAKQQQAQKEMSERLQNAAPTLQVVNTVLYLGLSGALILSGVGLLQVRPWGRWLSIAYGLLSLVETALMMYIVSSYMVPIYKEMVPQMGFPPGMADTMLTLMVVTAYAPVVLVVYPLITLLIMFLPSVAAAFRGETTSAEPKDYDDRYRSDEGGEPR